MSADFDLDGFREELEGLGCEVTFAEITGPDCQRCGSPTVKLGSDLCQECDDEVMMFTEVVASGGIYWKCLDCPSEGVLKPTAELSIAMRKRTGIAAPDAIGVDFSSANCPVCSPKPLTSEA